MPALMATIEYLKPKNSHPRVTTSANFFWAQSLEALISRSGFFNRGRHNRDCPASHRADPTQVTTGLIEEEND